MRIVICGSMSFAQQMADVRTELEQKGHTVHAPRNLDDFLGTNPHPEKTDAKITMDVFRDYFAEIGKADAVLVLNYDKKGIPGYVGANSLIEMSFAHVQNKKIFLLNPIPTMDYTDEIVALKPTILDGSLATL